MVSISSQLIHELYMVLNLTLKGHVLLLPGKRLDPDAPGVRQHGDGEGGGEDGAVARVDEGVHRPPADWLGARRVEYLGPRGSLRG